MDLDKLAPKIEATGPVKTKQDLFREIEAYVNLKCAHSLPTPLRHIGARFNAQAKKLGTSVVECVIEMHNARRVLLFQSPTVTGRVVFPIDTAKILLEMLEAEIPEGPAKEAQIEDRFRETLEGRARALTRSERSANRKRKTAQDEPIIISTSPETSTKEEIANNSEHLGIEF